MRRFARATILASCFGLGQPAGGPPRRGADVWEVIRAVRSTRAEEPKLSPLDLIGIVHENTGMPVRLVGTAVRYWASYPAEVDAEIAAAESAEDAAENAWEREHKLLAG